MYLFDSFDVDILTNTVFTRAALLRGDACVLRSFRATNVRGSLRNWMQVTFSIGNARHRTRVEGIALGKSVELDVMKSALPCDLPSGLHTFRMTVKCSDGSVHEESWNIEVLSSDHMCNRLTHADLAAAHVPMDSKALGEFAENATRGMNFRERGEIAMALYDALLDEELPYQPVRQMINGDHQVVRDGEKTLRYGGSCADLSLLYAGLCHMKGLSPLLVMLGDHMMAGCWLSNETSSVPVIYDQKIVLELIETGSLLILDVVSACKENGRSAEDAAEDALGRLSKPDLPMALVDVCAALRSGVRSVSAEAHASEDEFVCKNCGFGDFGPEHLKSSVVSCPACNHAVVVPERLRLQAEDDVKETDEEEMPSAAVETDEKKDAKKSGGKKKKEPTEPAKEEDGKKEEAEKPASGKEKKDKAKRDGIVRSLIRRFSRFSDEEADAAIEKPAETSKKASEASKPTAPAVEEPAVEPEEPANNKKEPEHAEKKEPTAPRAVKVAVVANSVKSEEAPEKAPVRTVAPARSVESRNTDTARCMPRGKFSAAVGANRSAVALLVPSRSQGLPVTRVEAEAFKGMPQMVSAQIGDGVQLLGDRAFMKCEKLVAAELPDSLTEMGVSAFAYCGELAEIHIPGSVKRLPRMAFKGCAKLVKVEIGEGVEIIDENCFEGCASLEHIVMPKSLKQIKANAFKGCDALARADFLGEDAQLDSRAFQGSGLEDCV